MRQKLDPSMAGSATTILVVDDDPDILMILKDNLKLDGYRVLCARDGREALDLFGSHPVDLIVLDLMLPDLDGLQICRTVRAGSRVPIILLTAKDAISDKVLGLECGADDYMVKPFDYLELAARIRARLRRSGGFEDPLPPVLEIGNLKLDQTARQAHLNGRNVSLTKKEFDLLLLLVRHAGRVLDRETIRQTLWPENRLYKWSRTIDVHIQHLRAKLEPDLDTPHCIITVQGVGYMLKPGGFETRPQQN
jgi:DNA-binding response OmpR family regulator